MLIFLEPGAHLFLLPQSVRRWELRPRPRPHQCRPPPITAAWSPPCTSRCRNTNINIGLYLWVWQISRRAVAYIDFRSAASLLKCALSPFSSPCDISDLHVLPKCRFGHTSHDPPVCAPAVSNLVPLILVPLACRSNSDWENTS